MNLFYDEFYSLSGYRCYIESCGQIYRGRTSGENVVVNMCAGNSVDTNFGSVGAVEA